MADHAIQMVSMWKIHPLQKLTSDILGEANYFDKDSFLADTMRSITSPNEKDNAYIDNLNNATTKKANQQ
jgi:hypothetical protein